MSRHAVAAELQGMLEQIQQIAARAERVALSSHLVSPGYFRGIATMTSMAAGELDQKGLLQPKPAPVDTVAG